MSFPKIDEEKLNLWARVFDLEEKLSKANNQNMMFRSKTEAKIQEILTENVKLHHIYQRKIMQFEEDICDLEMKLQQREHEHTAIIVESFQESLKRNEDLMKSFEAIINLYQDTGMTLLEANKNLTTALEKEAKHNALEKRLEDSKDTQKIWNLSSQTECKNCEEVYLSKLYPIHPESSSNEPTHEIPVFTLSINYNYRLTSQEKEINNLNEFIVDIRTTSRHWKMVKSSKYFTTLFKEIKDQCKANNIDIPIVLEKLNYDCSYMLESGIMWSNNLYLEKNSQIFQEILNTISQNKRIQEISAFKRLIEYPNKESLSVNIPTYSWD